MDKKNFWERFELHFELKPDLTVSHHMALFIEQTQIERHAYENEVAELRALLDVHNIDAGIIESGLDRSDKILDTLLRYGQGESGKLVKKGLLVLPYSWRRKYRKSLK